jgi:hypothetical protein
VLPPELQLLVLCGTGRLSAERREQVRELVKQELDWEYLLALAAKHLLVPLLHQQLRACGVVGSIPAPCAVRLQALFSENFAWQLKLAGELQRLLVLLQERGVDVLPYKGPMLAERLYGTIAMRQSSDLDLLIRRKDIEIAQELLTSNGYRPRKQLTDSGRAFMLRSRYSEGYERPDGPTIELHWAFTNQDISFPLSLEDLAPRLETARLGSTTVRVIGREDLLLILCVHGAKHLWARLEWICGVAELIRSADGIAWDHVLRSARAYGSERMLLLGLTLACDVADAPVPAEVERLMRSDIQVQRIAGEVVKTLPDPELITESSQEFGSLRHDILHFRLRERVRDRIRFLWYRVTTPSQPENWLTVPVAGWSFPVHSFVRPLHLVRKIGPAMVTYARMVKDRRTPL